MFADRCQAAQLLSIKLIDLKGSNPLVLAIPRGGVVIGAILAEQLEGELDVVFARKLRCPWSQELAMGAVAEGGRSHLTSLGEKIKNENSDYLSSEMQYQIQIMDERLSLIRSVQPKIQVRGRIVVVTDDGIATGATFISALEVLQAEQPAELIAAVPILPQERIREIKRRCDRLVYLQAPYDFEAVGSFYINFPQVEMEDVLRLLHAHAERRAATRIC